MRWTKLTWLERIWVYNAAIIFSIALGVAWGSGRVLPEKMDSGIAWIVVVTQVSSVMIALGAMFVLLERMMGRAGEYRGQRAVLTRGLRRPSRKTQYTVVAYPEGSKIMMRVALVDWKLRPWPLVNPVSLDASGEFSRSAPADNEVEIMRCWSELLDQARRRNQDRAARVREGNKSQAVAVRINSQRRS